MPDHDIELPACFYLGNEYDLAEKRVRMDLPPVMYDASDLLTHGVVVGMTGSGKTGLCLGILEEAAIDGIPCIVLDIKGDLTNLLLQFDGLQPADFRKWLNVDDAQRMKISPDKLAEQLSEKAKKGLADTRQPLERVQMLKDSGEWLVYTPGSDAGLPLSILRTFAAPAGKVSREALNQKIDATTSALLGLTGIVADPVQSREHILIAQILLHAWTKGDDLDLAQLISRVQTPPMRTVGAFDVETFYPEKDRLKLAVGLNNILASPSFSTWIEGDPLDLTHLLAGPKPRHLIFSLAHLEDSQRMFFLTLLLEEVLAWTRKQPGTTGLRALLYFDEVYGYLPPHPANPPTKQPLMTLLKQARAFGVGVLLATQNPVDLDYKALSNAGTWIIGKLQTERDKARLMEGLEGVAAERGTLADRAYLENVISSLGNRVFLLHDVHRPKPVLFQTRWTLSFLRGPMTREQIEELMRPLKDRREAGGVPTPGSAADVKRANAAYKDELRRGLPGSAEPIAHVAPVLPPGVVVGYLPLKSDGPAGLPVAQLLPPGALAPAAPKVVYHARLFAAADVTFLDKKHDAEHRRPYRLLAEATADGARWAEAAAVAGEPGASPAADAEWTGVPDALNTPKKIAGLRKDFAEYLYRVARMTLYENEPLGLVGTPGEDLPAFLKRCRDAARPQAQAAIEKEKSKFQQLEADAKGKLPTAADAGWFWKLPVVGMFRPSPSSDPKLAKAQAELDAVYDSWNRRKAEIQAEWDKKAESYSELLLKPRKADVAVGTFGVAWTPR